MNKRIISVMLALLLVLAVVPSSAMHSVRAEVERDWTVPEGYNEHDYNKTAAFLEQIDESGIKNGEKLSSGYDVNDPSTWTDNQGSGITFAEYQGELRLQGFSLNYLNVVGSLDLSECDALEYINVAGGQLSELKFSGEALYAVSCDDNQITEVNLSGCPSLSMFTCTQCPIRSLDFSVCPTIEFINCWGCGLADIDISNSSNLQTLWVMINDLTELDLSGCTNLVDCYCGNNNITSLDITHCPSLVHLSCEDNELAELEISCCPNLELLYTRNNRLTMLDLSNNPSLALNRMYSTGEGVIGYYYEVTPWGDLRAFAYAQPDDAASFLGWYSESGELLSADLEYDFSTIIGVEDVLIARFTGGEAIPGDVDHDGDVSVADALLALRSAMGLLELSPEQTGAADMNGDGTVSVDDALLILRTAMGLID